MTDPAFIADADTTDIAEPEVLDVNEDGVDDAIVITEGDVTAMAADTDLDGGADTVLVDIDGDGQPDVAVAEDGAGGYIIAFDRDGDGEFEEQQELTREELEAQLPDLAAMLDAEFDTSGTSGGTEATPTSTTGTTGSEPQVLDVNEDGIAETLVISGPDGATAAAADTDLDGGVDTVLIDLDGDGQPDVAVAEDGAGGYVVAFDRDGDGEFEEQQEMTRADLQAQLPELVELLDVEFDGSESGTTTTSTTETTETTSTTETPDGQLLDVDEDGVAETLVISGPDGATAAVVDTDADSDADTLLIDLDGDGQPDVAVAEDGAGGYVVAFDRDGDGEFEDEQAVSRAQLESEMPEVAALLDVRFDGQSGSGDTTVSDTPVSDDTTGTPDTQLVDVDEDGQDDAIVITGGTGTVVAADTEGDQEVDTVFLDLDNDGEFEAAVTEDGKGGYIVGFDNDGDGEYEEQQEVTREELVAEMPQIAELLDITLDDASGGTDGGTGPERAELVPEA
jgi:hypothetical protein